MSHYNSIEETENFEDDKYPEIPMELNRIITGTSSLPKFYKKDIILSYLRDHSIKNDWINANPNLTTLMLSGALSTGNIERLFELCRWNQPFRTQLEQYILEKLKD